MPERQTGLRNMIAGQTQIGFLDEQNQNFYYRGYAIQDLANHSTFEEVIYLLLYGKLPNQEESKQLRRTLFYNESTFPNKIPHLVDEYGSAHPMDVLATIIQIDGLYEFINAHRHQKASLEEDRALALRLISRMPMYCGFLGQQKESFHYVCDGQLARDFLQTLRRGTPKDFEVKALNLAFILYAEHEFDTSTFAVRLAASAHCDIYSAVISGINTLNGSRHGGAIEETMRLMIKIQKPEKTQECLDRFFETPGARLPGFGHAVYAKGNPWVKILKPWVKYLSEQKNNMRWYEITLALEEYMAKKSDQKRRVIPPGIDLWAAPLYYLLEIPIELFTPVFATSRIVSWCAHYLEVKHINKEPISRPRAEYVGPAPRPFIPIHQRE